MLHSYCNNILCKNKKKFTERFFVEPKMVILWYHFKNTLFGNSVFRSVGLLTLTKFLNQQFYTEYVADTKATAHI